MAHGVAPHGMTYACLTVCAVTLYLLSPSCTSPPPAGAVEACNQRVSGIMLPGGTSSNSSGHEDLPGVPAEAWVRVSRGLTPSEPYTQGMRKQ
jgi:hypothetical protein